MCKHRSFTGAWHSALITVILVAVLTSASTTAHAAAATLTWTGSSGPQLTWTGSGGPLNWTNTANWSPSRAPQAGDQLAFTGGYTYGSTLVNDLPGFVTFDSLVFGQSFVLQGQPIGLANGISMTHPGLNIRVQLPIRVDTSQSFYVESSATLTIEGELSGGGLITKTGPGRLILANNPHSWTGGLAISAGELTSYGDRSFMLGSGPVTLARGAQMELDGVEYANDLTLTGCTAPCKQQTLTSLNRERVDITTLRGAVTLAGTPGSDVVYIVVLGSKTLQLSGPLSGAVALNKLGTGELAITGSAANHLTGSTVIQNGELTLINTPGTQAVSERIEIQPETSTSQPALSAEADNQLTPATIINIASPGVFNLQGTTQQIGCFAGSGVINLYGSASTLAVNAPDATCPPFTGTLSGTGRLKVNPGAALALADLPAPFPGALESAGEARLSGLKMAGPLIVQDQVYLSNAVQVSGDAIVNGSLVSEGSTSASTLGSLQVNASGRLAFHNLRAGQPGLIVTGPVSLNGSAFFTVSQPPLPGQSLTLIRNDGAAPIAGTFSGIAEGRMLCSGGNCYRLSYSGGDGNDLTLTRLEPVSLAFSLPQTITFGQPLTLHVTVSADNPGAGTPTGYVSLYYWANVPGSKEIELGTYALDASGQVALTGVRLPIGSLDVEARYGGSATFELDSQYHTIVVEGEQLFLPKVVR